jgi:predicted RNA-binding protein (virulence factor B family)
VLGFGAIGMIHSSERNRMLRLGEEVKVRVTLVREDGRVNLAMSPRKEVGRDEDAERLIAFLKERPGGGMPYSDATPPDIIKQRFGISKSAFKRAMGKLMKEGLVTQKENWTYLVENIPEPKDGNGE